MYRKTIPISLSGATPMSQTTQLIAALKRCLRMRGMTYRDLAAGLGISEASVKRTFAEETFTLSRLEQVCRQLDMSVYELARLAGSRSDDLPRSLSEPQEAALAETPALLSYFYLLLNGWTPARICARYGIDERQSLRLLLKLDLLKLIELLPRNRVRLRTARNIQWRRDGPVRRQYEKQVMAEFTRYGFVDEDSLLSLETGELSAASCKVLLRRLQQLVGEFNELAELDLSAPAEEKRGMGLLLALRPWVFSIVAAPP
jgi:DNA-binding Xre family transcriptional regulator